MLHKLEIVFLWIVISVGIYMLSKNDRLWKDEILLDDENLQRADEMPAEENNSLQRIDKIRVLIKTSGYENKYHNKIGISGTEGIHIKENETEYEYKTNEIFWISANEIEGKHIYIMSKGNGKIQLTNVERNEEVAYRGIMECIGTKYGIVLINEVNLEEYLYGVVPSEMPASYPYEALKAQAISARTYAYYHGMVYAYPDWKAHVDDSTAYQVYMNLAENELVTKAVDDTKYQVMLKNNKIIESFYYSTSSGYSSGYEAWNISESVLAENKDYLQVKALIFPNLEHTEDVMAMANQDVVSEKVYREFIDYGRKSDIEYQEPWYRWTYTKDLQDYFEVHELLARIYEFAEINNDSIQLIKQPQVSDVEKEVIHSVNILERSNSGLATKIEIDTSKATIIIVGQQLIREVFATNGDIIIKQDKTTYRMTNILPSAYFYVEELKDRGQICGLIFHGGGMGHGAGMSQNGAKCLAQKGYTAENILNYYYYGINVKKI